MYIRLATNSKAFRILRRQSGNHYQFGYQDRQIHTISSMHVLHLPIGAGIRCWWTICNILNVAHFINGNIVYALLKSTLSLFRTSQTWCVIRNFINVRSAKSSREERQKVVVSLTINQWSIFLEFLITWPTLRSCLSRIIISCLAMCLPKYLRR